MPGYKYEGFRNRFYVTKAKYGWISRKYISCELHAIESGFIAQIKQNINILIDFEVSHLKN